MVLPAQPDNRSPFPQVGAYRSKRDLVYGSLRNAILRGDLQPGARLVIDDLARALGVSPIPVREALQQLEADGFVAGGAHQCPRVTEIDASSIAEVFSLMETFEVLSGRAACTRLSAADLEWLEAHLQRMEGAKADLDAWSQGNVELHEFICARAQMPLVALFMAKLMDHWERLRRRYLHAAFAPHVPQAQQDHWAILEALRSRDPERVEQAIRAHTRRAREAYGPLAEQAAP